MIQIGAQPDSGFEDPIGMLVDCHRRIERFLHILCAVPARAAGRSLTGEERSAVESALEYFRVGGTRHNADEEESLFPRLIAQPGAGECEVLESEHAIAARGHEAIESLYRRWIADGALSAPDRERIEQETAALKQLYEKHIRLEEQVVFPRARRLLSEAAIQQMGQEFRDRRRLR